MLSGCTIIASEKELEKVLEHIPSRVPYSKICTNLEIRNVVCNELIRRGEIGPYTIAKEYIQQKVKPCWEDIIRHLCQDFYAMKHAANLANKYNVSYSKLCDI